MREGRESTAGFGKILRNSRLPLRLFRGGTNQQAYLVLIIW